MLTPPRPGDFTGRATAAEHAMAAIRGMDKALRADWMEAS